MDEVITIKCKECGWTFTGTEYLTEIAFDEHCMDAHPDPPFEYKPDGIEGVKDD